MTQDQREHLSAGIDGELAHGGTVTLQAGAGLVHALASTVRHASALQRYHIRVPRLVARCERQN